MCFALDIPLRGSICAAAREDLYHIEWRSHISNLPQANISSFAWQNISTNEVDFLLQEGCVYATILLGSQGSKSIMRRNHTMRARYGTGVFLKLNKRNCKIRVRLTPIGADFMRVHFRIGGDNHYFYPSCVMGDQFSSFLTAVYCLYNESYDYHQLHMRQWKRRFGCVFEPPSEENGNRYFKSIPISWDEEGSIIDVTLSRSSSDKDYFAVMAQGIPDPINIEFSYWKGKFQYTVDGRDLCYAVARGYTEAIKKYGFQGYLRSTGMQYIGDTFEMEELLFVKAYALGAMEARELKEEWKQPKSWKSADSSSFEKEIELFLFDM